jgi:hypothetical protein
MQPLYSKKLTEGICEILAHVLGALPNKELNIAVQSAPRFPPTLPSLLSSCLCAAPHRPSHRSEEGDLYATFGLLGGRPSTYLCVHHPDRYSAKWSYVETAHVVRSPSLL